MAGNHKLLNKKFRKPKDYGTVSVPYQMVLTDIIEFVSKFDITESFIHPYVNIDDDGDTNPEIMVKIPFIIPTKMRAYRKCTMKDFDIVTMKLALCDIFRDYSNAVKSFIDIKTYNEMILIRMSDCGIAAHYPFHDTLKNAYYNDPNFYDFEIEDYDAEIYYTKEDDEVKEVIINGVIHVRTNLDYNIHHNMILSSGVKITKNNNGKYIIRIVLKEHFTDDEFKRIEEYPEEVTFGLFSTKYSMDEIEKELLKKLKSKHVDLPADEEYIEELKELGLYKEGDELSDFDDSATAKNTHIPHHRVVDGYDEYPNMF